MAQRRGQVPGYVLEFHDLYFTPANAGVNKKHILNGISGRFRPGHLSAILGPSGAGKTSLLNILSGFKSSGVSGSVCVNGEPLDSQTFRRKSCYITQEFAMLPVLTVRETLDNAAILKIGSHMSRDKRKSVIVDIAGVLGLVETLDRRVCNLSGGEMKRLSIGLELVTNPPIMFFDEPTSGLDSFASLQVMQHMKRLAEEGRTIIVVIHQPSSRLLELVDDLFILASGQCLYNGPLDEFVPTFNSVGIQCPQYYNRADFALEVACRERGKDYIDTLIAMAKRNHEEKKGEIYTANGQNGNVHSPNENSFSGTTEQSAMLSQGDASAVIKIISDKEQSKTKSKLEKHPSYPVSRLSQFCILFRRCIICNIRDLRLAVFRITAHILVAVLLGLIYYDFGNDGAKVASNFSCLFFIIIFNFYGTAMHTVMTFPMESAVVIREHFNNWYSLGMYYLAKVMADFPLQVLCPTLFLIISYQMTGQLKEWDRFLMFWLVCIELTTLAQTFGSVMGSAFGVQLGLFLTCTTTMPMFLISGFFIHLDDLATYLNWLSYTSVFRYGLEAAAQTFYGYDRAPLHCSQAYCHFKSPKKFLQEMGMEKGVYWFNVEILALFIIAMQILLYFSLKWKVTSARRI